MYYLFNKPSSYGMPTVSQHKSTQLFILFI